MGSALFITFCHLAFTHAVHFFVGNSVSKLLDKLGDSAAKNSLLGMVSFYKEVIKDLQKKLTLENVLLKALTCLNPRQQRTHNSLQHCKVVASQMPCLVPQEQVIAGDEWIHYQEINVGEADLQLRVDHFCHEVFTKADTIGDQFSVLPKMIKCARSCFYYGSQFGGGFVC